MVSPGLTGVIVSVGVGVGVGEGCGSFLQDVGPASSISPSRNKTDNPKAFFTVFIMLSFYDLSPQKYAFFLKNKGFCKQHKIAINHAAAMVLEPVKRRCDSPTALCLGL
jgi:hypothetical protein